MNEKETHSSLVPAKDQQPTRLPSKFDRGSLELTSSSPEFGTLDPNTLELLILILPPNIAEAGEEVDDPNIDDDVFQRSDPEPGAGLKIEDTNKAGERIDKSPAAEKDLLCDVVRCLDEVISVLPPRLIERLSNGDLATLNVCACSGVERTLETGVKMSPLLSIEDQRCCGKVVASGRL